MAVRQAEVAAQNIATEINGSNPNAEYKHEIMLVIDTGDADAIFLRKNVGRGEPATVRQGRFWRWAKRIHEMFSACSSLTKAVREQFDHFGSLNSDISD